MKDKEANVLKDTNFLFLLSRVMYCIICKVFLYQNPSGATAARNLEDAIQDFRNACQKNDFRLWSESLAYGKDSFAKTFKIASNISDHNYHDSKRRCEYNEKQISLAFWNLCEKLMNALQHIECSVKSAQPMLHSILSSFNAKYNRME